MLDKNEKQEPQQISGTVDGIVAYKQESGFVVFDLDMQGELVTVVGELGKFPSPALSRPIQLTEPSSGRTFAKGAFPLPQPPYANIFPAVLLKE